MLDAAKRKQSVTSDTITKEFFGSSAKRERSVVTALVPARKGLHVNIKRPMVNPVMEGSMLANACLAREQGKIALKEPSVNLAQDLASRHLLVDLVMEVGRPSDLANYVMAAERLMLETPTTGRCSKTKGFYISTKILVSFSVH